MVKSKKMSKTGIAVIVLAILLVLSMIMGMTGAWYTASDSTSNAGEAAHTFVLNDFVTITATGEEASSIKAYTVLGGTRTEVPADAVDGNYYLFPEDEIEVVAGGEYQINAAQQATDDNNVDFWYVVRVTGTASDITLNNGATANGAPVHFVAGTSNTLLASFRTVPVVGDTDEILESENVSRDASTGKYTYKVKSSLTVADEGKSFTIAITGAGIEVRAIQYNNISAEEAAYMLGDGWNNGAPTAKAAVNNG